MKKQPFTSKLNSGSRLSFGTVMAGVLAFGILQYGTLALAKPTSDDFNTLIQENESTQQQLRHDLEKELNTREARETAKPNFNKVGEAVLGHGSVENVAVDSGDGSVESVTRRRDQDRQNFRRLSQELKDIK